MNNMRSFSRDSQINL